MASNKERIGLFGGSFDPPHVGHLIIAEQARVQLRLGRIYFIPAFIPPHKRKKSSATPKRRFQMTKLAVKGNSAFKVSNYEIARGGVSYTIDTVKEFRRRYPNAELFLIIGTDNLIEFRSWKSYQEILKDVTLIAYPRSGRHKPSSRGKYKAHVLQGILLDISSSAIRNAVRLKRSVSYIVPDTIKSYIESKKLYRK